MPSGPTHLSSPLRDDPRQRHRVSLASNPAQRIFCAFDTRDLDEALILAELLGSEIGAIKLGSEFFTAHGPEGIRRLAREGHDIFLDLKFHDIPNTVSGAVRASAELGVKLLTVHVSGASAMLEAAVDASRNANAPPRIIGVTVLTSLDDQDLNRVGQSGPASTQVTRLARVAVESGLDGIVCSPREVSMLRQGPAASVLLITPGIRPEWAVSGDQKRAATPYSAIASGADCLVIGRPITQSDDPVDAVRRIADEIDRACAHG